MKKKIAITVNDNLLEWVHEMIEEQKEFSSVSHAIQKALALMKKQYETREKG